MVSQEIRDRGKAKGLEVEWLMEKEEFGEAKMRVISRVETSGSVRSNERSPIKLEDPHQTPGYKPGGSSSSLATSW
ncbi:hypothetical protein N7494_010923 [Penicillium frequentans]|uniref:Uncharacterized protein n=1 Tax=Penicillium frequentans TaxID=3151616 RepID=A0AAD6CJI7_9EURO|nr:hypothetical protein N7494_010923 [Penicillium glabrum]